jgi:hypothetical protein
MWTTSLLRVLLTLLVACTTQAVKPSANAPNGVPVALPDGAGGIGFDDLGFAHDLHRVLVPAGRTGNLVLVDASTQALTTVPGFSRSAAAGGGGHGEGTTSADEGGGLLFAIDRDARQLDVVDPAARTIVAHARLAGGPDYVRFVSLTHEVWVTEPGARQIEVFSLPATGTPTPTSVATIVFPDGPESLIIDAARQRAYTHEWGGTSHAVDVKTRAIVATWKNGCAGSRGIALDAARGFLFVGCDEGKAVVLDVAHDGQVLGALSPGVSGVDIIAYNPTLAHLYLPGESSGSMAILAVSASGGLVSLGVAATVPGAHCVAADDQGNAWVCDPEHGQLLRFRDPYPASR